MKAPLIIRSVTPLLAATATVLFLAACGPKDSSSEPARSTSTTGSGSLTEPKLAPSIVSDTQIEDAAPGSPERALLEWWSAFQFRDAPAVEAMTAKDAIDTLSAQTLDELVGTVGSDLPGIKVVSAEVDGDAAIVRVLILGFRVDESGEVVQGSVTGTPQSFEMAQLDGEWLFDEPAYIRALANTNDIK
jgi:hypothetical protein